MKNKNIKNLLTIITLLFATQVTGNEWEKIDFEKVDRLKVIHGKSDSWKLAKPLLIFDNSNLKGNPLFKIDNEKVYDLREKHTKKMPKVDFLDYASEIYGTDLKINAYSNGIAEVLDHDKKYYLKFSKKSFTSGDFPDASWRRIRGDEALKIYEKIFTNDKEFKKATEAVNNCIDIKNVDCLVHLLNVDEFNFYRMAHFYWKYIDKKECTDLKEEWESDHFGGGVWISKGDELVEFKKNYKIPWDLLKKVFKLKSENILIRTKDFGKVDTIEIDFNDGLICTGRFKKNIYLMISNNKIGAKSLWKIELVGDFIKDTNEIRIMH